MTINVSVVNKKESTKNYMEQKFKIIFFYDRKLKVYLGHLEIFV